MRQQGLRTMKHLRDRLSTPVANVPIHSATVNKTEVLAEVDHPHPGQAANQIDLLVGVGKGAATSPNEANSP